MRLQIADCRLQIGFPISDLSPLSQIDLRSGPHLRSTFNLKSICNLQSAICNFTALIIAFALSAVALDAQGRRGRADPEGLGDPAATPVTPAEVQRMFDAYALMQAQEQLKIADEQFTQFLTRYKALQDVRRRALQERARIVAELRRMLASAQPDETQLRDRMKALQDVEARSTADVKRAYDAIDQVLDVHQQAKFRVFEELMERRKLELVTRARQANRPRNQQ
jgi:Spy/CpxP family protein refolding chaperone